MSTEQAEDRSLRTDDKYTFGMLLRALRTAQPKKISQAKILAHLPGWSPSMYSQLEDGTHAPHFSDLPTLYGAFLHAGAVFSPTVRQQFVRSARRRLALQKTHKDSRTDMEWTQLLLDLMRLDGEMEHAVEHQRRLAQPFLADVGHLIDRSLWHEELMGLLSAVRGKKLIIVRGVAGVGKSSELSWLATKLLEQPNYQVILCNLHAHERVRTPEEALQMFLGAVCTDLGMPLQQSFSLEEQTALLLGRLERLDQRLVLLIDHAECLLQDPSRLAASWELFISAFLRIKHQAKFILVTRLWPGWAGNDPLFVEETTIPPLSQEQAVSLLQRLGLQEVPTLLLQDVYRAIGGIPLCLEWVATWVKQPLQNDWETFEMDNDEVVRSVATPAMMNQALEKLLAGPRIFGGPPESALAPFLERLLSLQSLSDDARHLLHILSVAAIPLAKPAFEVICSTGPGPYEELRRASLVVASQSRAQLLPMVAVSVLRSLTSAQVTECEQLLIEAYTAWLKSGQCHEREAGGIVTELSMLLLKLHSMLDAAQLLIRYGWLAFNLGYAGRLARFAADVMDRFDWRETKENECGGLLLHSFLSPFLGNPVNTQERMRDYHYVRQAVFSGEVALRPLTEVYLTRLLMAFTLSDQRFEEAQVLFEDCSARMAPLSAMDVELRASLLELQALLLARRSDFHAEQEEQEQATENRERAIQCFREICRLLSTLDPVAPLAEIFLKKRFARALTNLGYQLGRVGRYKEALPVIDQSIVLKEQGYAEAGTLASSYGEKSQALAALGRLEEALCFDQLALDEIERLANAGDALAQAERWIYLVNRACLYLRLQKVDEAEGLLRSALPNILPTRRTYFMLARKTLAEIEQWRRSSASRIYQRDWRWEGRLREALSFNSFSWLAHAGPFSAVEQQEWEKLAAQEADDEGRKRLEAIISRSRQRELAEALAEGREPRLWYPAIPIAEVRSRLTRLLELDAEVCREEPDPIIRELYHDTIEERVCFLRLIEAAYVGDRERFWQLNRYLHPEPTQDEMEYTLLRVGEYIRQGLRQENTVPASRQVLHLFREQLHLTFNPSYESQSAQEQQASASLAPPKEQRFIRAQAVQRFLEDALYKGGCEGWQVILDKNAPGPRVEAASRLFILPDQAVSLNEVKSYLQHEVISHIADAVAGEQSSLGLLAIGTKGYMPTSEGLALYHEMQAAAARGVAFDDSKVWLGTLSTGLASGIATPPQSFLSLYSFLKAFLVLYRRLRRSDEDEETTQKRAHDLALSLCLRTYRGVPELQKPGLCFTKDAVYLRGLLQIQRAVAQDATILDRLAVGRVALEYLPAVERLGIPSSFQPLRKLAQDANLDAYILSFEESTAKIADAEGQV